MRMEKTHSDWLDLLKVNNKVKFSVDHKTAQIHHLDLDIFGGCLTTLGSSVM